MFCRQLSGPAGLFGRLPMPAAAAGPGDEPGRGLVRRKGIRVRLLLGLDEVVQAGELAVLQLQLLLLQRGGERPLRALGAEFEPLAGDGPSDGVGVVPVRQLGSQIAGVLVVPGLELGELLLNGGGIAPGLFQRLQLRLSVGELPLRVRKVRFGGGGLGLYQKRPAIRPGCRR